jgi:hypothetical protein
MHPTKLEDLARALTSEVDGDLKDLAATRRGLILAPLLAALPAAAQREYVLWRRVSARAPNADRRSS